MRGWLPTRGKLTKDGEILYSGDWQIYFVAMLDFRNQNLFNIVDIYRGSAQLCQPCVNKKPYIWINQDGKAHSLEIKIVGKSKVEVGKSINLW